MEVQELALPGLLEIRPRIFTDERGYFFESYNQERWKSFGLEVDFVQDNQSFSSKGVVRGLHFQLPPFEQGKLVRVIVGKVLDIALDIRQNSPTYGQYLTVELSAEKQNMLYIPPGFAHGFSALEDSIFHYKCTHVYHQSAEMGINPLDPELGIDWKVVNPIISAKDLELPMIAHLNPVF